MNEYVPDPNLSTEQRRNHILAWMFQRTQDQERRIAALEVTAMKIGVWRDDGRAWQCRCRYTGRRTSTWNDASRYCCPDCGVFRPDAKSAAPQLVGSAVTHAKDAGHSPSCSDCAPSGYACDRHFMPSDPGALQRLDRIYPERLARFKPVATLDGSEGSARSTAEIGTWFGDGTWKCGCDQYPPRPADWADCGACKFTRPVAPATSLDQANQELTSLRAQLSVVTSDALCVACGVNKRLNQFDRWCRWCRKDDNAKLARLDAAIRDRDALKKRVTELELVEPVVLPPGSSPSENIEDYAHDLRDRLEKTERPEVRTRMIIRALAEWAKAANAAAVLELERVRVEAASQARTDNEQIRRLVSAVQAQRERVEQALRIEDD